MDGWMDREALAISKRKGRERVGKIRRFVCLQCSSCSVRVCKMAVKWVFRAVTIGAG